MPAPSPMIVVAGLATRGNEMLMQLRPKRKLRPDLWEHPGGKVEPGENPITALAREWGEELLRYETSIAEDGTVRHHYGPLHIAGCIGNRITTVYFTVERPIELSLYHVALPPDIVLSPNEAQEAIWVDPLYAVERLPLSPGSYLLYPWIRGFMFGDWSLVPAAHRIGASIP